MHISLVTINHFNLLSQSYWISHFVLKIRFNHFRFYLKVRVIKNIDIVVSDTNSEFKRIIEFLSLQNIVIKDHRLLDRNFIILISDHLEHLVRSI